jgi:hypothetical protein
MVLVCWIGGGFEVLWESRVTICYVKFTLRNFNENCWMVYQVLMKAVESWLGAGDY